MAFTTTPDVLNTAEDLEVFLQRTSLKELLAHARQLEIESVNVKADLQDVIRSHYNDFLQAARVVTLGPPTSLEQVGVQLADRSASFCAQARNSFNEIAAGTSQYQRLQNLRNLWHGISRVINLQNFMFTCTTDEKPEEALGAFFDALELQQKFPTQIAFSEAVADSKTAVLTAAESLLERLLLEPFRDDVERTCRLLLDVKDYLDSASCDESVIRANSEQNTPSSGDSSSAPFGDLTRKLMDASEREGFRLAILRLCIDAKLERHRNVAEGILERHGDNYGVCVEAFGDFFRQKLPMEEMRLIEIFKLEGRELHGFIDRALGGAFAVLQKVAAQSCRVDPESLDGFMATEFSKDDPGVKTGSSRSLREFSINTTNLFSHLSGFYDEKKEIVAPLFIQFLENALIKLVDASLDALGEALVEKRIFPLLGELNDCDVVIDDIVDEGEDGKEKIIAEGDEQSALRNSVFQSLRTEALRIRLCVTQCLSQLQALCDEFLGNAATVSRQRVAIRVAEAVERIIELPRHAFLHRLSESCTQPRYSLHRALALCLLQRCLMSTGASKLRGMVSDVFGNLQTPPISPPDPSEKILFEISCRLGLTWYYAFERAGEETLWSETRPWPPLRISVFVRQTLCANLIGASARALCSWLRPPGMLIPVIGPGRRYRSRILEEQSSVPSQYLEDAGLDREFAAVAVVAGTPDARQSAAVDVDRLFADNQSTRTCSSAPLTWTAAVLQAHRIFLEAVAVQLAPKWRFSNCGLQQFQLDLCWICDWTRGILSAGQQQAGSPAAVQHPIGGFTIPLLMSRSEQQMLRTCQVLADNVLLAAACRSCFESLPDAKEKLNARLLPNSHVVAVLEEEVQRIVRAKFAW